VLCQMVSHVRAFHRGATAGMWLAGGLPPRQQYQRVEFLVGRWREPSDTRHGWLVHFWQFVVWARQLSLLSVASASEMVLYQFDPTLEAHATYRAAVKWTMLGLGLLILLVAFAAQVCFRPFVRALDNSLEAFLLAMGVLVLLLGGVYDQLLSAVSLQHADGALSVVQALIMFVLLSGLLVATLAAVWDARRDRAKELSAVLTRAEQRLDGPIRERLLDGSIRLLRCAWLLSVEANAELGRSASGVIIIRRRQDLPEAAFVSPCEAATLFDRADRFVLVLSYRWLTAARALKSPKPSVAHCVGLRASRSSFALVPRPRPFWLHTRRRAPLPHERRWCQSLRALLGVRSSPQGGFAQARCRCHRVERSCLLRSLTASCPCRKRTTTACARPRSWKCSSVRCPS
jgi:hypothetical protein